MHGYAERAAVAPSGEANGLPSNDERRRTSTPRWCRHERSILPTGVKVLADGYWILISISTPAGRSRRWSESTVLGDGSTMSNRRLCTRISKCSRLSLYL